MKEKMQVPSHELLPYDPRRFPVKAVKVIFSGLFQQRHSHQMGRRNFFSARLLVTLDQKNDIVP
jgi:hypothetical protein